ncbi:MAG: ABC transporter ATP-binding protein/permease [Verrucomicrobia bacterium]|nr:ABC transporter ATP-binding protein/permease [Verrucomicrobiota bacterium]MCF7709230.1 ABC transporter ATP-binding protein/permease [Verrucomicrobiota bacterium]
MRDFLTIIRFAWPYFRRYSHRLIAGVLLGILFGLSMASFVWATKTLIARMDAQPVQEVESTETLATPTIEIGRLERWKTSFEDATMRFVDPWLPLMGRPLDWKQIIGVFLFLPILVSVRGYTGYLASYCMAWVSERVVNDMRLNVVKKLNSLSLDYFTKSSMGDLLTRVNTDTAALQRFMSGRFQDLVKEPMTVLFVLAVLCLVDWRMTIVSVIFLPLLAFPLRILGRKARRSTAASWDATISQSSLLVEALKGIRIVQAFGLERLQIERFRRLCKKLVHYAMKNVQAKNLVNPLIETTAMLGLGLLILYIFFAEKNLPDMMGFLTGVILLYTPIKKLSNIHVQFQQTAVAAIRLDRIFKERPTIREPEQPKPFGNFEKGIAFENITFSYEDEPVLQDINLLIPRGHKLGVAGESGSGKSTMVNLLFRFYDPQAGAIKIDDTDIRDFTINDLRSNMALVSQEVVLFDQTIAENIACGKTDATDQEIIDAARNAYAHDFISRLPENYNTRIGEGGIKLSGGQRQRIAIARAFIRNAPILVLDEATASLDSQAEAEVQAAVERLARNRTVISVAHRLSTLSATDEIIVLRAGRIIEQGTFNDLLGKGGQFSEMASKQGILTKQNILG